ncbi:Tellurite resistance protein TehA [Ferrimonas sediminum]|uniref:Tellurite resistance protein TehA n=1 Tax=Ferrimonas sediminum TaxID=718193 RepID=A0A1G8X2P8_9GAMM|nr:TDT family transporter [Ferrimonas sediminum]SDJ84105.1 Tellurite resistance protein TehA [Ferrimonas sediminum]
MSQSIIQRLQRLPTPMAGLALGIASLGVCLDQRLGGEQWLQTGAAAIAAIMLLMVVSKFVFHPGLLKKESADPLVGSVMPTFTMATMMVSKSLALVFPTAATGLWLTAVSLHLLLLGAFVFFRIRDWNLSHMIPSWFVPPIGIIVAALTCPSNHYQSLAHALIILGLVSYAILLPTMLYRLIFLSWDEHHTRPTFAIMAAPASLTLAGYLTIESAPSPLLVTVLLGIALTMTTLVYLSMLHLLRLPFSPGYAAFTFPLVVSATALYESAKRFQLFGLGDGSLLRQMADIELTIAVLLVSYVAIRYLHAYWPRPRTA